MILQQISVFLENRAGQLAEITELLAGSGINLVAINIAESSDYGIARIIADDPEKAELIIRRHSALVSLTPVVAVGVPHRPGGLSGILQMLAKEGIDISYTYSILGQKDGLAQMVFRVEDPEALEALFKKNGLDA